MESYICHDFFGFHSMSNDVGINEDLSSGHSRTTLQNNSFADKFAKINKRNSTFRFCKFGLLWHTQSLRSSSEYYVPHNNVYSNVEIKYK